jgi:Putative metal-binding motif
MKIRTMLVAGLLAAACRSAAGGPGPGETDAAVVTDTPVAPMDRNCTAMGMENTNEACSDGLDNDCNGFFDCNDFACSRNPAVTICPDAGAPPPRDAAPRDVAQRVDTAGCVQSGSENTATACGDGRDNDCDGFVDCGDLNCSCQGACPSTRSGCTCSGPENTNMACGDGRDNDCNGFMDCNDFNCSRNTQVMVCGVFDAGPPRDVLQFRDVGVRGDSAGCTMSGGENTPTACTDGMDNDCDGFVDCADRNCSCVGSCEPVVLGCTCSGAESSNTTCGDNIDNDCNGFVDCRDFSCSRGMGVNVCPDAGM